MAQYRWNGMTRNQVRGTVRKRLWALARGKSRYAPAARDVRCLNAAKYERLAYLTTRNPFHLKMHGVLLETRRYV